MKNVGAHSPTKMPKRSAWAWASAVVPPVRNQIAIDPMIEAKPRMKQSLLSCLSGADFIRVMGRGPDV